MTKNVTTYAVGDIHGHLDLLKQMWDAIHQHANDTGVTPRVVFLGDYVDRGPDSKGVIDFVKFEQMHGPTETIALCGNHEDMFVTALENPTDRYLFEMNGGNHTLRSYAGFVGPTAYAEVPDNHINWMKELPYVMETEYHIFVHAGMLPHRALDDQFENQLIWVREPFLESASPFYNHDGLGSRVNKHVIHGHTPWPHDRFRKHRAKIRTNLDSGAFHTGVLTCAVIPNDCTAAPSEFIQVKVDSVRHIINELPDLPQEDTPFVQLPSVPWVRKD